MKYYNNILECVGNTPLVKLNNLTKDFKCTVLAKMENFNPGGSVKDRIGIAMIEDAEKSGKLKPGGTIVEASSGNTGIGLALAATVKGYKCVIVVKEKTSPEKKNYLKALGAEIFVAPSNATFDSPEYYLNKAKSIAENIENSFYVNQYTNTANPECHYKTTGREIWNDTDGKITHFVAGLGTGGTITGAGRYLKEKNPGIKIIAADPSGSIGKAYFDTGKKTDAKPHLVEGVGMDIIPEIMNFEYVDEVIEVSDKDSIEMCHKLAKYEGIFSGASTGTYVHVALQIAQPLDENAIVVVIICDTGERYISKYHSEEWLKNNL
jgi:cystathionine beta-synthase